MEHPGSTGSAKRNLWRPDLWSTKVKPPASGAKNESLAWLGCGITVPPDVDSRGGAAIGSEIDPIMILPNLWIEGGTTMSEGT